MANLESLLGRKPYAYQTRVAQALLEGKNVILRAPTGAGKTEAALAPYLLARATAHETFPLKAMLACPMKTLAKSIHSRAQKLAPHLDVRLHTGEDQNAPLLEGDIVVTTIDQLMSNYAHIPLSMSNGRANIGAGAVISSYIVFDEFHLHDPKRAFRTALEMIRELRGIAPFLLMTATLSSQMVQKLAEICRAVVIEPTAEELVKMPSQNKKRFFQRHSGFLLAEDVAEVHEQRSLAICNTVARAQALFEGLQSIKNASPEELENNKNWQSLHAKLQHTQLEQIHSQFFPSDRAAKEQQLEAWMGKGSKTNIILVATQAIEVGINISSEHLHTELCPANSLLQRAGRCARFELEKGVVHVYQLPLDAKGNWRILPYKEQNPELETTWAALEKLHEQEVNFSAEASLIDTVHTARDSINLTEALSQSALNKCRKSLRLAREGGDSAKAQARELIRLVVNTSVLLHPKPEEVTRWYQISTFELCGVAPYKLKNLFDAGNDGEGWTIKLMRDEDESETNKRKVLTWYLPKHPEEIETAPIVALNPARVHYDDESGLTLKLQPSHGVFPKPKEKVPITAAEKQDFWYIYESYQEHIERVLLSAYHVKRIPEIVGVQGVFGVLTRIEKKFNLPSGSLEKAIRTAIVTHDIGKLAKGWQRWSRIWQKSQCVKYPKFLWNGLVEFKGTPIEIAATNQSNTMFSAHTDTHPSDKKYPHIDDEERQKALGVKRPGHAGQSAWVFVRAFANQLSECFPNKKQGREIIQAVYWAIARHHGAYNQGNADAWELDRGAAKEIMTVSQTFSVPFDETALNTLESKGITASQPQKIQLIPECELMWLTYSIVSRALRLADQLSFDREEIIKKES